MKTCARNRLPAGAFTLLELVGVMAVVSILAALLAENVLERMRLAARDAERASLATLAGAVEKNVIRSKVIPAPATLPTVIAADLAVAQDRVSHSAQGNARWIWLDPGCAVGATNGTLPYTQTASGSVEPTGVRMLVISSVGASLPSPAITSPTADQFAGAWNTVGGGLPPCLNGTWNGDPDDLSLQRLEVGALFRRLILENVDNWRNAPYSIETTNTLTTIAPSSRREMWFLSGTVVNFHYSDNTLQAREYLLEDASYTFENGRWTRYLRYGPNRSLGWFGEMVDKFLAAPAPPNGTRRYATQQWVIDAMYQFLYCFGQWSLDYFYGGPPWPHIPGYEQSSAGATGLSAYSSDLLIN